MSLKSTYKWCRRYISLPLIITLGVLAYVLFFNDNSVVKTYEHEREISRLEQEIASNRDTLNYYTQLNDRLDTDRSTMEQIVREQYHMQRPNEDIYLIDE